MKLFMKKALAIVLFTLVITLNAMAQIHSVAPDSTFVLTNEMVHTDEIPDYCEAPVVYQWWRNSRIVAQGTDATLTISAGSLPLNQLYTFQRCIRCGDCGHLIYSPKVLVQIEQAAPAGTNGA